LTAAFITGTTTVLAVYGKERTQRKQKKEREHVNARICPILTVDLSANTKDLLVDNVGVCLVQVVQPMFK